MSTSTHNVVLKATDGLSSVFAKVGHSGDAMAQQLVRDLQQVERGTQTMGRSIQQAGATSEQGLKRINAAGVALGAGLGTLAGLMSEFARGSEGAAQVHRQLEQAIQNTGASFETYSAAIERAGAAAVQLGFDDEAAFSALQVLTENTGSAAVALDQLGLAEDLAAAKGMSLESAAKLISRVYEGNTGILKRYGIVVAEGATATEALAQVQTQVAGQAEAHATSLARWHEELSNVADAVGGALGGFAPFVAMLPGLSIGLSAATGIVGGFTEALKESGAASKALSFALGPGGLLTVGAALAAVGVYKVATATDQYDEAVRRTLGPTEELATALERLGASGAAQELQLRSWANTFQTDVVDPMKANIAAFGGDLVPGIDAVNTALAKIGTNIGPGAAQARKETQAWFDAMTSGATSPEEAMGWVVVISENLDTYNHNALAAAESGKVLAESLGLQSAAMGDLGGAFNALKPALTDTAAGQKLLDDIQTVATEGSIGQKKALSDLYAQYLENGSGLEALVGGAKNFADQINRDTAALRANTLAGVANATMLMGLMTAQADAAAKLNDQKERSNLLDNLSVANSNMDQMAAGGARGAAANDAARAAADRTAEALTRVRGVVDGTNASFANMYAQSNTTASGLDALTEAYRSNETALDRVARGSTSAAVQMRAFHDVQDGLLSQQEPLNQLYGEYGTQLSAIERAQGILNQRQAEGQTLSQEQIDFLNGAAEAQANLTEGQDEAAISAGILAEKYGTNLDVGQQMAAAMADTAGSTKDLTAAVVALIETLGGIPPEFNTDINVTDNATEPVGGILSKYDGLPEDVPTTVTALDFATDITNTAHQGYNDLPEDVSTNIVAIDLASGTIESVRQALYAFDGATATATINTVYNQIGSPASQFGLQHGGIAGAMRNGGVVYPEDINFAAHGRTGGAMTWVGEAGPEMVNLPYGSMVTPAAASKMGSGGGGGAVFNFYASVTIKANDPQSFMDQMHAQRLSGR